MLLSKHQSFFIIIMKISQNLWVDWKVVLSSNNTRFVAIIYSVVDGSLFGRGFDTPILSYRRYSYNPGEKKVGAPDAIYYNYPHAQHCSWKWGMTLFNRKQRRSRFYHNPSQPPSNQCWGIWQGFWQHESTLRRGKGFLFLLNQTKCPNHFFQDCRCMRLNFLLQWFSAFYAQRWRTGKP